MLGFEGEKGIITGEYAAKIIRHLNGVFTPEEIAQNKECEKRLEKARKKWKVIWKNNDMEQDNSGA